MGGILRVAFINDSEDPVTVHITTQDNVETVELLATTPALMPDQDPGIARSGGSTGWDLVVSGGAIFGFTTEYEYAIADPSLSTLRIIKAAGKDPWPQPPPPPPKFVDVEDYEQRFANFLMAACGATPAVRKPQPGLRSSENPAELA